LKFGGVQSAPFFFPSTRYCISIYTLGTMYHLSLGVRKIFCCLVIDIVIA
jgi:hypothetical protein